MHMGPDAGQTTLQQAKAMIRGQLGEPPKVRAAPLTDGATCPGRGAAVRSSKAAPTFPVRREAPSAPGTSSVPPASGLLPGSSSGEPGSLQATNLAVLKLVEKMEGRLDRKKDGIFLGTGGADDEDVDVQAPRFGRLPGARGAHDSRLLDDEMQRRPAVYADLMERLMTTALSREGPSSTDAMHFLHTEVAVSKQKTLGYMATIVADIHRASKDGDLQQVRLKSLRGLACIEQYCLDDNWKQAWKLTGLKEPPWGRFAEQHVDRIREANNRSQLIPQEWASIMIQAVQDEAVLVKARGRKGRGETEG